MKLAIAVVLAVTTAAMGQATQPQEKEKAIQFTRKYDRFKNQIEYQTALTDLKPTNGDHRIRLTLRVLKDKDSGSVRTNLFFGLIIISKEGGLQDNGDGIPIRLILDGETPYTIGDKGRSQYVYRHSVDEVVETVVALIFLQDVDKVGAAEKIEGQVGDFEFVMSPKQIEAVRAMKAIAEKSEEWK